MVINRLRKSSSTPSSSPGKPSLNGRNYYYYNCKPVIPTVDRNVSSCPREMRPGSNNGWLLKPACLLSLLDVWEESLRCPLGTTIREGVGQAVSYCVCHVSAQCESLRGCFDASSAEYWVPRFLSHQSLLLPWDIIHSGQEEEEVLAVAVVDFLWSCQRGGTTDCVFNTH